MARCERTTEGEFHHDANDQSRTENDTNPRSRWSSLRSGGLTPTNIAKAARISSLLVPDAPPIPAVAGLRRRLFPAGFARTNRLHELFDLRVFLLTVRNFVGFPGRIPRQRVQPGFLGFAVRDQQRNQHPNQQQATSRGSEVTRSTTSPDTGSSSRPLDGVRRLPLDFAALTNRVTEDEVSRSMVIGPDPARPLDAIARFAATGFTEVHVHQAGPDQKGFLRFYASRSFPGSTDRLDDQGSVQSNPAAFRPFTR
ncbi:hypothetical protein [Amycolatopsis anabasis]|uniref:hypothetical protein n=1 Tax=Amycolatopsis anabasis TaxID=1840409 RepID=UPI00131BDA5B|nr:hypothetical protein [Amycolatopsis anabasis]